MAASYSSNYAQFYRNSPDALEGDYGAWMGGHSTAGTPGSVKELMLNTSDAVPKVYLYLTSQPSTGAPVIQTVFRPALFRALPGRVSAWDNQVFGFGTDLNPGNQITSVTWPPDAFNLTSATALALDAASMTPAWAAAPLSQSLGPFLAADANVVVTRTRFFMAVPHDYVPLVIGATLTPRELWVRLYTAIQSDNRLVACAPLIDWMRVAGTLQADPDPTAAAESAALHTALVAPVPDALLSQHRWNFVTADMPELAGSTRTQEQALMHAVAAMQQSNAAASAAAQLDRAASRAPKLPSTKYPATIGGLMQVCGVATEGALPDLWHQLANAAKHETRGVAVAAMRDRARQPTAATSMVPVVTKEVLERFTQQTLAAESPDALEEGLQFYLFALGAEDHQAETRIRNQLYDLVQSGSAAPSVSDSRELSSSKVVIPTDNFGLTTAMQLYSIALDVYLGVPHAFAEYYRTWLRDQWAPLQQELGRYISQVFQGDAATAYARFGRWISLRVNEYLVRLSRRGATTPLPDLDKFATLISTRENPFPPIPERYMAAVPPTPKLPAPPALPRSTGTGSGTGSAAGDTPGAARSNERAENLRPSQEVKTAFTAVGLRTRALIALLRPPMGQHSHEICPSYHGIGGCYTGCGCHKSHRPLSAEDKTKFLAYCVEAKALAAATTA